MGGMEVYGGQSSQPGHEGIFNAGYTTRGNITGTNEYPEVAGQPITKLKQIDKFGKVVKEQLSCYSERSYTSTQTTYYAPPDQVSNGGSGGTVLVGSYQYDFNTSVIA